MIGYRNVHILTELNSYCQVGPGRRVAVGSSGVALQSVPGRAGRPAHVYALSDQGMCLRPHPAACDQGIIPLTPCTSALYTYYTRDYPLTEG